MFKILLLTILICTAGAFAVDLQQKGGPVTATADSLLAEGDRLFQERDYQQALTVYAKAAEFARKEFNPSVQTESLAQVARMHLIQNRKDEGREFLKQAADVARDSDPMGWSRYLGVAGRFEWQDNDLAAARQTFEQMFDYCNVNALHGRAVDAAHMIAIIAETPEEQIEWGRRGIEAAEASDQEKWLGPLFNNLAATYWDNKQFDSALTAYEKAREYHWRFSGEIAKLFADYHVGMTHRSLGNYDDAKKWLRPVLAWAERLENHGAIGQACEDLGEIAVAEGDTADGLALLNRAREQYKLAGYNETWPEIWDNINKRLEDLK